MTAAAADLDARVDHCPACGAWRFDRSCTACDLPGGCEEPPPFRKISGAAALEVASTPLAGREDFLS